MPSVTLPKLLVLEFRVYCSVWVAITTPAFAAACCHAEQTISSTLTRVASHFEPLGSTGFRPSRYTFLFVEDWLGIAHYWVFTEFEKLFREITFT